MIITVQSFIPWLQHINGKYEVGEGTTVSDFLAELGLQWDHDVLVGINDRIAKANDLLSTEDQVILMIPLTGG